MKAASPSFAALPWKQITAAMPFDDKSISPIQVHIFHAIDCKPAL
jgi:hypothetical protein